MRAADAATRNTRAGIVCGVKAIASASGGGEGILDADDGGSDPKEGDNDDEDDKSAGL